MSTKYLGKTIDIHGGGQDLEFPHHENEIAQSEAATGQQFVRYWMHNGFVTIGEDNEKMSKSLHNFVTVHDMVKKIDPQVLRFSMSTTQYRRPIQFSRTALQDAANNLKHIKTAIRNLAYRQKDAVSGSDVQVNQQVKSFEKQFVAAMDDDFNVQNGIAVVYELVKFANVYAEHNTVKKAALIELTTEIQRLMTVFGIELSSPTEETIDDDQIKVLIEERNNARAAKDFQRSDEIRDELKAKGIILEDTPQGTRFRKE